MRSNIFYEKFLAWTLYSLVGKNAALIILLYFKNGLNFGSKS